MELLTFDKVPEPPLSTFIPGYSPQALLSTPRFAYLAPLIPSDLSRALPNPPAHLRPWRLSPDIPLFQPLLMTFHDESLYTRYQGQSVIGIVVAISEPTSYSSREATINARARIRDAGRLIDATIPDIRHPGTITLMVPEPATGDWIPVAAYPSELSPLTMGPAVGKVTPPHLTKLITPTVPSPASPLAIRTGHLVSGQYAY